MRPACRRHVLVHHHLEQRTFRFPSQRKATASHVAGMRGTRPATPCRSSGSRSRSRFVPMRSRSPAQMVAQEPKCPVLGAARRELGPGCVDDEHGSVQSHLWALERGPDTGCDDRRLVAGSPPGRSPPSVAEGWAATTMCRRRMAGECPLRSRWPAPWRRRSIGLRDSCHYPLLERGREPGGTEHNRASNDGSLRRRARPRTRLCQACPSAGSDLGPAGQFPISKICTTRRSGFGRLPGR
jgi:hypothetical protein